ncbi:MAG: cytochrome C oxidase subunit IV family protein [Myxococcales bacterium]|nr:cytochrome C oxidase subunit IV family protein [Myxococcales bacterium]
MSEDGHHTNYVKIWVILVVLLGISVVGPMAEIRWLTLVTAFGIACVKAYLVADKFMHINQMPKFVNYIVVTCLVFMLLFFAATAPDIMNDRGSNWVKPTWIAGTENDWVTVGMDHHGEAAADLGEGHGEDRGEDHGDHHGGAH